VDSQDRIYAVDPAAGCVRVFEVGKPLAMDIVFGFDQSDPTDSLIRRN